MCLKRGEEYLDKFALLYEKGRLNPFPLNKKYIRGQCGTDMELLWEENKVICPNCGCWDEISDDKMDDFDGRHQVFR